MRDIEFLLEKPALRFARGLAEYADNPKIASNLRDVFPNPYTEEDAKNFLRFCIEEEGKTQLARLICVEDKAVGCVSVSFGSDVSRLDGELGYWLGEAFWGRGIMTRAVKAFAEEVFKTTPLVRIHAAPFSYNAASCRVLEKAGFTLEGVLKKSVCKGGKLCDARLYARIKEGLPE